MPENPGRGGSAIGPFFTLRMEKGAILYEAG